MGKIKSIYQLFNSSNNKEFSNNILQSIVEFDSSKYFKKLNINVAKDYFEYLNNKKFDYEGCQFPPYIKWKESNFEDLTIYNQPYYKIDILACYNLITRGTINWLINNMPYDLDILDYGGGLGATTLQLSLNTTNQIFYYDFQADFFKYLLCKYKIKLKNLNIIDNPSNHKYGMILLLEFLEHIEDPIKFIVEEIFPLNSRYLCIAVGFNNMIGLGHYQKYPAGDRYVYGKKFTRIFNLHLKSRYKEINCGWNKKPILWKLK